MALKVTKLRTGGGGLENALLFNSEYEIDAPSYTGSFTPITNLISANPKCTSLAVGCSAGVYSTTFKSAKDYLTYLSLPNVTTLYDGALNGLSNLSVLNIDYYTQHATDFWQSSGFLVNCGTSSMYLEFPNVTDRGWQWASGSYGLWGGFNGIINFPGFSSSIYSKSNGSGIWYKGCHELWLPNVSYIYSYGIYSCNFGTLSLASSALYLYSSCLINCRISMLYIPMVRRVDYLGVYGISAVDMRSVPSVPACYTSQVFGTYVSQIIIPKSLYSSFLSSYYWSYYSTKFISV